MQFLSVDGMNPTHVEASLHQIERSSVRVRVLIVRVHPCLNLFGQETVDGCGTFCREYLAFFTVSGLRLTRA